MLFCWKRAKGLIFFSSTMMAVTSSSGLISSSDCTTSGPLSLRDSGRYAEVPVAGGSLDWASTAPAVGTHGSSIAAASTLAIHRFIPSVLSLGNFSQVSLR